MCPNRYQKSSLMAYNAAEQTTGNNAKFAAVTYQSGVSINFTAGSDTIYLQNPGLYYVAVDVVFGNTTAATASNLQMYVNGVALAGALTEATIIAAGDSEPGSITAVVPVPPQCPCSKGIPLTFVIGGTTATIKIINITIMKIA